MVWLRGVRAGPYARSLLRQDVLGGERGVARATAVLAQVDLPDRGFAPALRAADVDDQGHGSSPCRLPVATRSDEE